MHRDLSNAMSTLNITQNSSRQDQRERDNLRAQYNASKAAENVQIPAPMPTRATAAPTPTSGMWSPDMGIKFSAPAPVPNTGSGNVHNPAYPTPRKGGTWTPGAGMQFR